MSRIEWPDLVAEAWTKPFAVVEEPSKPVHFATGGVVMVGPYQGDAKAEIQQQIAKWMAEAIMLQQPAFIWENPVDLEAVQKSEDEKRQKREQRKFSLERERSSFRAKMAAMTGRRH